MSKAKPGFCVLSKQGEIISLFSYPGSSKHKRLELLILIKELVTLYKPEFVIFESTFTKFKRAASTLSVYQGLISSVFVELEIPMYQVSNLVVKNYFGCTEKEDLFKQITKLYGLSNLDFDEYNDEVDALAIGLVYLLRGKTILKEF